ncbi:hypothetical protein [uncultured Parolsenella sp.]|uniref:hypothetical protein n=1 Tax=uncultured Parolsenella sp. TaxID=2083008 RepID=UPI0027D931A9|nr:hypothetical protein [uncultured Parolsenella sp.]
MRPETTWRRALRRAVTPKSAAVILLTFLVGVAPMPFPVASGLLALLDIAERLMDAYEAEKRRELEGGDDA